MDVYVCRVCGLRQEAPPWGEDGSTPMFDICGCCGTEFGYHDATLAGIRAQRERWLSAEGGPVWRTPRERPPSWDVDAQLAQIPDEFR